MATFTSIQKRVYYLLGEIDYTTASDDLTMIKDNINFVVQDIVNLYPFSWNLATETLTLASGVSNLATNYNPKWHIEDARIEGSSDGDDTVFTEIRIQRRDDALATDSVYWITYNTTTTRYIFNSNTSTGSVVTYYHFFPTDMSTGTDVCIVPDGEAVALLAAAKYIRGDEGKLGLQMKADFITEGMQKVVDLWVADQNRGPAERQGTPVDYNSNLKGE